MKATNHQSSQDLATFLGQLLTADDRQTTGTVAAIFGRHGVAYAASEARVQALVQEIELDGGNTIANLTRRRGVSYERVVRDVCKQLKCKVLPEIKDNVPEMERQLVYHVIANYLQNAPEVDRNVLLAALRERGVNWRPSVQGAVTAAMWASLLQQAGARVAAQAVRQVVLRTSGWFAARAAAGTVLEVMALAIPAVNVAMTAWLVVNVADPAYRKTVPTVLDIALLRMEFGADVN